MKLKSKKDIKMEAKRHPFGDLFEFIFDVENLYGKRRDRKRKKGGRRQVIGGSGCEISGSAGSRGGGRGRGKPLLGLFCGTLNAQRYIPEGM